MRLSELLFLLMFATIGFWGLSFIVLAVDETLQFPSERKALTNAKELIDSSEKRLEKIELGSTLKRVEVVLETNKSSITQIKSPKATILKGGKELELYTYTYYVDEKLLFVKGNHKILQVNVLFDNGKVVNSSLTK